MQHMSKSGTLAALQACMIYLIMNIVDYSTENEGNGLELLLTLSVSLNPCFSLWQLIYEGPHHIIQSNARGNV